MQSAFVKDHRRLYQVGGGRVYEVGVKPENLQYLEHDRIKADFSACACEPP